MKLTDKATGYLCGFFSTATMGFAGLFVRNIESDGIIQTFFRYLIGIIFLFAYLKLRNEFRAVAKSSMSIHLITTAICVSGAMLCYITAIQYTSLVNALFLL